MRLATRIVVGFGLIIAVMAGMGTYQLELIRRLNRTNRALSGVSLAAVGTVLDLRRNVEQLRQLTLKMFVLGDRDYLAALDELRSHVGEDIAGLAALGLAAAERREVDRLRGLWLDYVKLAGREEPKALTGGGESVTSRVAETALTSSLEAVTRQLEEFLRIARLTIDRQVTESSARVERARWVSAGAAVAGLVLALAVSLVIVRSVAVPVGRLGRATHELARGDFSHRVEASGGPELAALAADFNAMAARLQELDHAKRDFVSNVSHDLKAPLASIEETLRLLLDGPLGPLTAQQERLLGLARASAGRLAGMIADLLDAARLESGAAALRVAGHDLDELMRTAVAAFEVLARERSLMLVVEPPGTFPLECDGPLVVRVIENLLSNAVRFSPPSGTVRVAARRLQGPGELPAGAPAAASAVAGGAVLIEVSDQGPGIPDSEKSRVFERFRGSHPGRGVGAGTGLGLAIARSVVEGHGGVIWLHDRPGGGTVATVVLPVRPPAAGREGDGETVG